MDLVMMLFLGFIFGILVRDVMSKTKTVGNLRIDTSDPDGPYMFLELTKGVDYVYREKYITLKVDTHNYISQE